MDPEVLRGGFRLAVFVALVAAAMLPFQDRESAEFVVTVLALVVGLAFAVGVAALARRASPPLPRDKRGQNRYTGRDSATGRRE